MEKLWSSNIGKSFGNKYYRSSLCLMLGFFSYYNDYNFVVINFMDKFIEVILVFNLVGLIIIFFISYLLKMELLVIFYLMIYGMF